jgi:hypothetical protein
MKRLIEIANSQIIDHLVKLHNWTPGDKFNCMVATIDWKDIPDDLDLTRYEVQVINVLDSDCHLSIIYNEYGNRNRIDIKIPSWLKKSLFSARIQGQEVSLDLLTKLKYENILTQRGEKIPYDNTIS